jgi:hypothetical protein
MLRLMRIGAILMALGLTFERVAAGVWQDFGQRISVMV